MLDQISEMPLLTQDKYVLYIAFSHWIKITWIILNPLHPGSWILLYLGFFLPPSINIEPHR